MKVRTSGLIVDHPSKVLDTKLGFMVVFGRNVVGVQLVLRVEFVQHGGITPLEEERGARRRIHRFVPHRDAVGVPWGTCFPHR